LVSDQTRIQKIVLGNKLNQYKNGQAYSLAYFVRNNMSKLETKVAKLLKENNISYEREKTYKDLKLGQFRFDFFLPEQNTIIEVNGDNFL
jgi:very-short-patch-repair endonuclease